MDTNFVQPGLRGRHAPLPAYVLWTCVWRAGRRHWGSDLCRGTTLWEWAFLCV